MNADTTAPTVVSITDDTSGGPIAVNTVVTYTVTFSEDMNSGTVASEDFNNAGTSAISYGAINEISPGVFTVVITPTTEGTLQLRIPVSASMTDTVGNALVNNPAILDGLNLLDDEQRLFVLSRNRRGETRARRVSPPEPVAGEPPIKLSEAFLRGLIGGLPQNF